MSLSKEFGKLLAFAVENVKYNSWATSESIPSDVRAVMTQTRIRDLASAVDCIVEDLADANGLSYSPRVAEALEGLIQELDGVIRETAPRFDAQDEWGTLNRVGTGVG